MPAPTSAQAKVGRPSICGGAPTMPAADDDAERWQRLAEEALAVAERMTDPEAKRAMLIIAEGYQARFIDLGQQPARVRT